jgi:FMNH2-dependent dimethyl sulfone monooxygenase
MSNGRWGINVVTGFAPDEIAMFGMKPINHDLRYDMAGEFTDIMNSLWLGRENLSFAGKYWSLDKAFVSPKPVHGRPVIVNAASSPAGLSYAAKYADLIFITSPGGADIDAALETLPAHTAQVKSLAAQHGRDVRTLINPHVICRETEKEARQAFDAIAAGADPEAVDRLFGRLAGGDTASWKGHTRDQRIVGGNVQLVGSPEQVVDLIIKLKRAGCDGIQLNFFDFEPDLQFFGERVLPLMKQAGLRAA